MAAYGTITKIIKHELPNWSTDAAVLADEDSGTAGTQAKKINDYIETLDDSTNTIINISSLYQPNTNSIFTIIVHKG
jgi:hypothetical protein